MSIKPGNITLYGPFGTLTEINPDTGQPEQYVYQRTIPELANAPSPGVPNLQRRIKVKAKKGNTVGQERSREAFKTAVANWKQMSKSEKAVWVERGKARTPQIPGYQMYISDSLNNAAS